MNRCENCGETAWKCCARCFKDLCDRCLDNGCCGIRPAEIREVVQLSALADVYDHLTQRVVRRAMTQGTA